MTKSEHYFFQNLEENNNCKDTLWHAPLKKESTMYDNEMHVEMIQNHL